MRRAVYVAWTPVAVGAVIAALPLSCGRTASGGSDVLDPNGGVPDAGDTRMHGAGGRSTAGAPPFAGSSSGGSVSIGGSIAVGGSLPVAGSPGAGGVPVMPPGCVSDLDCIPSYHCSEGLCRGDRCLEGSSLCTADGVAVCASNGSDLLPPTPCAVGEACVQTGNVAACLPGCAASTVCRSARVVEQTCIPQDAGVVVTYSCDSTTVCIDGRCRVTTCVPRQRSCFDSEVRECDALGNVLSVVETCAATEYCDPITAKCRPQNCSPDASGCEPPPCTAGQQESCNGNSVAMCKADGSGFESAGEPCGTLYCVNGRCEDHLVFDNFEDGNMWGWTVSADEVFPEISVVAGAAAAGSVRSVDLWVTALSSIAPQASLSTTFPPNRPTTASFWGRALTLATPCVFELGGAIRVGFDRTGLFTGLGPADAAYDPNRWYHFELRNIDWTAGTYSAYLDGGLVWPNYTFTLPTQGEATSARILLLGAAPNETVACSWDEIAVW